MPYKADVYKIFIASPSDTAKERAAVSKVINEWNIIHSENQGIILRDIFAEQNAYADSGKHPQKIINEQLVENSDLLVAIFKMKFGSQTDTHESGTAEEIDLAFKMKKHVMLFFYVENSSAEKSTRHSTDIQKINELKAKYSNKAYYQTYTSLKDFESKFSINLSKFINDYFYDGMPHHSDKEDLTEKIQEIIAKPKLFRIDIFSYPNTNGYADDTYDIYDDHTTPQSSLTDDFSRPYCSAEKSLVEIFPLVSDEVCANTATGAGVFENAIIRAAIGNTPISLSNLFLGDGIADNIIGYMIKNQLLKRDCGTIVLTEFGRALSEYIEKHI